MRAMRWLIEPGGRLHRDQFAWNVVGSFMFMCTINSLNKNGTARESPVWSVVDKTAQAQRMLSVWKEQVPTGKSTHYRSEHVSVFFSCLIPSLYYHHHLGRLVGKPFYAIGHKNHNLISTQLRRAMKRLQRHFARHETVFFFLSTLARIICARSRG